MMISFFQKSEYGFYFSPIEREVPAHVHIIGRGGQMIVWLKPMQPALIHNLSEEEQKNLLKIVEENLHDFLAKWHEWYDSFSVSHAM